MKVGFLISFFPSVIVRSSLRSRTGFANRSHFATYGKMRHRQSLSIFILVCLLLSSLAVPVIACPPDPPESCSTPGKPALSTPSNHATCQNVAGVVLSWSNVGAHRYYVYMDTSQTPTTYIGSTTGTSLNSGSLSQNTKYYWRVMAYNYIGCTGPKQRWSDTWDFTTGRVHNITTDAWYCAIQGAIEDSNDGDVIEVSEGTYYENLNFNPNEITLTSTDPNNWEVVASTIIDANGSGRAVTFDSGDANSVLRGFTITGGNASQGAGIYCYDTSPYISNCVITGNISSSNGGGMFCDNSASPTVKNCVFSENDANSGGGIYNIDSSPKVINCIFRGNDANCGGGIYDCNSSPTVINCTFTGNSAVDDGGGMYNYGASSSPIVTNCIFWDNYAVDDGDEIYNSTDPNADPNFSYCDIEGCGGSGGWDPNFGNDDGNNIDSNPYFIDASDPAGPDGVFGTIDDGLHLQTTSPCIDAGDPDTDSNDVGVVDLAGNNRFMDGDCDDENVIDMGAYELPTPTVWYVDYDVQDGNGFSWANAYDDLQDALDDANDGEQIWVAEGTYKPDGTDPNNRLIAFELVEGVAVYGGFDGNETNWFDRDLANNTTILSGDINKPNDPNDNSFHVVIGADRAILDGFTITGGNADGPDANSNGGGIYCDESNFTVRTCIIGENTAEGNGGGIYCEDSSLTVTSCVIVENEAGDDGGGMYNHESSPKVINCTFNENDANNGGGMYNYGASSNPTVTNCIFWGNNADDFGDQMASKYGFVSVSYSCIHQDSEPNDMISYWKFDEGSGTIAYDSVGDNDGNLVSGPNWVTGIIDGALSFDGSGDYVLIGDEPEFNFGSDTDFTISVWIHPASTETMRVVDKIQAGTSPYRGFELRSSLGGWFINLKDEDDERAFVTTVTPIAVGTWQFIAAVADRDGNLQIYYNGVSENTTLMDYIDNINVSIPLAIGRSMDYNGQYFNGKLDDVRIYDRALSPEEIQQLYQNGLISMGEGSIDSDPCFADANNPAGSDGIFGTLDDGLRLMAESPCIDTGDNNAVPAGITTDIKGGDRINGIVDMGAYEYIAQNVFYVDKDAEGNNDGTSWDDAYTDLQDALGVASSGEEIWVAEGTYKPGISRSSTFQLVESVGLYGGFASTEAVHSHRDWVAHETILSGDINAPGVGDNSYHVVTGADNAILDGFTITGGNADGTSSDDKNGGGIYCYKVSPTIRNCVITSNTANYGGGMCSDEYPLPEYPFPTVVNCIFSDNTAADYGGGMYNRASCSTVINCIFFSDNTANYGGGMYNHVSSPTVINCTFTGNSAADYGGGIMTAGEYGQYYHTMIRNCIIWGNNAGSGGYEIQNSGSIVVSYSDVKGCGGSTGWDTNFGTDEGGNIDTDPCFVDNDFHLDTNSVCIDAGFPLSDYSNESAPNGNRINMGAYGNTSEAAITIDEDGDGLPDAWQRYYWSDYDPNDPDPKHDPNGNPDNDKFSNWIEYLFGYDPNAVTVVNLEFMHDLSSTFNTSRIDPTQDETFTIKYIMNMDAEVKVSFTNTDTKETVRTMSDTVTAGPNQAVWDGTGDDEWIVERYFYDVNIDANDGDYTWTSPDGETSTNQGPITPPCFVYDHSVDSNDFNPYKNIPVKIKCRTACSTSPHQWWTRSIDIVKACETYCDCDECTEDPYNEYLEELQGDPNSYRIYHVIRDRLLEPGWNTFYWYGRWGGADVNDPNAGPERKICKEPFDVYFDVGGTVTSGVVVVYYEEPISNLRCNPYRILPIIDEVTTITYDLSCNANVTIDIYDPDGSYFGTLLKDEPQTAGLKKVVWYGKEDGISSDPETNYDPNLRYIDDEGVYLTEHDPNMRYITDEGVYRIEVGIDDVNEMLEGTITVKK